MEITWLGYSCFRLKGSQAVIITDPFPPDIAFSMGKAAARIVTVSHQHPAHSYVQGVADDPKVLCHPGEYEISGILILGLPTFHDSENGAKLGKNIVFLVEIDGISICHLGDLGHPLSSRQVEEIGNVDVLLVPVGGVSTLNAQMAAQICRQLEPKIVIPMHFKTAALSRPSDPVEPFLKEMGKEQITPQPKINVSRSNLPETTQVVLLSV